MRLTLTIPDNVTARLTKGVIFGTFSYSVGQFGKLVAGKVFFIRLYVHFSREMLVFAYRVIFI